jgi:hypothetical protein
MDKKNKAQVKYVVDVNHTAVISGKMAFVAEPGLSKEEVRKKVEELSPSGVCFNPWCKGLNCNTVIEDSNVQDVCTWEEFPVNSDSTPVLCVDAGSRSEPIRRLLQPLVQGLELQHCH